MAPMSIDEREPVTAPERSHGPARPGHAGPVPKQTVLDQMGGLAGFAYSTIPVLVFITANALLSLPVAIAVSIATGLALFIFRLLRKERFVFAIGSLLGMAVAAGLVAWTGSARDFFVIGIWASLAGFLVTLASVLVRRPLTGVIWNALHSGMRAERQRRDEGRDIVPRARWGRAATRGFVQTSG